LTLTLFLFLFLSFLTLLAFHSDEGTIEGEVRRQKEARTGAGREKRMHGDLESANGED
jgi:hypothetical protein